MKIPFFIFTVFCRWLLRCKLNLRPFQFLLLVLVFSFAQAEEVKLTSLNSAALSVSVQVESLIAKANELKLAEQKQWIDLLHIRPNALGLRRSQVKGAEFFLAKDGFKNPQAELIATLQSFFSTESFAVNKHPLCLFPARKRWLQEKLQIEAKQFPQADCSLYDYYIRRLRAESVSIVFSSYYPNNPGSVFGHTLFRINKKLDTYERRNELLDHGIGYAANANIDNPVLYAVYGLFGGFKGVFSTVPYFYKVREYNDFESRSLWSYDLDLTADEVAYLVDHLWEVGGSYFDYYFFTQNCGFHMLTVLEAAAPRLRVAEHIPFWVIPSDAVKVITEENNLVKSITYRASAEEKFYQRWNQLNEDEKNDFRNWKNTKALSAVYKDSEVSQIRVLDAIIDFFDYKNPNVQNEGMEQLQEERNQLLLARARIQKPSSDLNIQPSTENRPDQGHESGRFGFRFGANDYFGLKKMRAYQELQVRFALHDLLDRSSGYPPGANIEFMNFRFRHWDAILNNNLKSTLQLEEFTLFRLISLFPIDEFHRSPSWNFSVTSKRIYDEHCLGCYAGGIEGGAGFTLRASTWNADLFGFLNSSLMYSKYFKADPLVWKLGPQLGFLMQWDHFYLRLLSEIKWSLDDIFKNAKKFESAEKYSVELRHNINKEWSYGVTAQTEKSMPAYEIQLYKFF